MSRLRDQFYSALPGGPLGLTLVLAVGLCGCGGGGGGASSGPDYRTAVDTRIEHQPCAADAKDYKGLDANRDGRADVRTAPDGSGGRCRVFDLNLDGQPDSWTYYNAKGQLVRREADFDRDGRIDEIALYVSGHLSEKRRATTLGGALDTWQVYKGGQLAVTRRDADLDGYLDQWWEYPDPAHPECPLIHSDVDGDGRPDPGATVAICEDKAAAASSGGSPVSAPAEGEATAESGAPLARDGADNAPATAPNPPALPGKAPAP